MVQDNQGWIKTTCAYCGVGCGVEARPKSNGELEVRGDKQHPSNFGKLCTKGIALGDTVIHDGRLLFPTKRDGGNRESLTWDDALTLTTNKFSEAIEKYGPDSVAFYVSGQLLTEDYYVANKLIKGFIGTSNIDSNSRLCMASSVVGHKRAFGSDTVPVCYEDLEHAELVVLVGSNLAWCHPVLFQRLRAAKQDNPALKVIVVDPRVTETCSIADEHLAINSGSDVALFNGLLAYLTTNGHLDAEFIHAHTDGFEGALQPALLETDIERKTGLTSSQLARFYADFATTDKVVTVYSQGVNQSSQGSDKVNSILNCHLATAKLGRQGCGPFSVTGQPNAMGGREVGALANTLTAHMEYDNTQHLDAISDFWGTSNLATKPGLKAIDMFDAMLEGKIKAVWIMATNPMVSLPDSAKIEAALKACPFVVVSDCIADTATTRMADLLLPAQGWSEKSGTVTNSERRISRQRRVLPSPGMARPDWWIISQIAQRMGFSEAFDYLHEGEIFREYAKLTTLENQQGERDLNLIGLTQLDDQGYSKLTPQQWPVQELQEEIVNQRFFSDGRFFTQDNKANFIPVSHSEPLSKVDDEFPLLLNSGRSRDHWHTMTRTGLSARLAEHQAEPYVLIHPQTAKEYGIESNQIVEVSNKQGECLARAQISLEIMPKQLFVPIHWNESTANNSKPCALIIPNSDQYSGQPEFKHTPVTIKPTEHQSSALFFTRSAVALEQCDYWARQKIDKGYLYRIESTLTPFELAQVLKKQLSDIGQVVSFEGDSEFHYQNILEEKVAEAIYVNRLKHDWEIEFLVSQFNAELSMIES